MTVFLVLGGIGLLILLLSLVVGDWFDGIAGWFEIDLDGGGLLSGPVLSAFLAAFGIGGAAVMATTDGPVVLGIVGGLANGLVIGYLAFRLTRAFMHMPTDAPIRTADLVGKSGRVITPIPDGGLGEILVRHGGQPLKLSSSANRPLVAGTNVVITQVVSTSAVLVTAEDDLFETPKEQSS